MCGPLSDSNRCSPPTKGDSSNRLSIKGAQLDSLPGLCLAAKVGVDLVGKGGGRTGTRTLGPVTVGGFQDRCNMPLCDPSEIEPGLSPESPHS